MNINAYAKINLYLDSIGKREDGYHELVTVMRQLSLCDKINIEKTDDITITCDNESIPADERNSAYKCAQKFFEHAGINGGARIEIEKHIPVESGLGGSSADGAAVLIALNELYSTGFSQKELADIGAQCGADIPFCVMGKTALCTGIGEVMEKLPHLHMNIVIARGKNGVSTGQAYQKIDALEIPHHLTADEVREKYMWRTLPLYNIFEKVLPEDSEVFEIKKAFADMGQYSLMTGSGSAVFALFPNAEAAELAAIKLRKMGYYVHEE